MKKISLLTLLSLSVCAVAVSAQEEDKVSPSTPPSTLEQLLATRPILTQTLTREEAVETALRESPVLRGAVAEVEMAQAQLNQARAERRPVVGLSGYLTGGSSASNVRPPSLVPPQMVMRVPEGFFAGGKIAAMYPLYTGDRLSALTRGAEALRDAAQSEVSARRHEVALLTRLAYHEALARRALVDVFQDQLQENEEQLRVDRIRAEEGKIPPFYVQRAEAEVAATRQLLVDARRDVELALIQLKTVMGVHPLSEITLAETLEYSPSANLVLGLIESTPAAPTPTDTVPATAPLAPGLVSLTLPDALPALLRSAEENRPELAAVTGRTLAAQAQIAAERSAYKPQVDLFAMGDFGYRGNSSSESGTTFGLVASLPLFDGGLRRSRVDAAQAARRQQEEARAQIALQVGQEVTNALLNLRAAEQNVANSTAALEAAQEDYRVARIRYEAGKSIPVEVLDALAARTRAQSNVVQAKFQFNAARDQLLRAVGVLEVTPATVPAIENQEENAEPILDAE